jgi:opacity protein-like surface antigen
MGTRFRLATLLALVAIGPATALAQYAQPPPSGTARRSRLELTGLAGWQVNTDVDTSGGDVRVDDSEVFGAAISKETFAGAFAELLWLYSDPTVSVRSSAYGSASTDVPTHYFQIGGTKGVTRGRTNVFGGLTIGATLFLPGDLRFGTRTVALDDTWRFGFTAGGGFKVDLGERLALRFDARVAAPVYFSSGGFYVGSSGAGVTVSGGVPLWQWNFLGGLVFLP